MDHVFLGEQKPESFDRVRGPWRRALSRRRFTPPMFISGAMKLHTRIFTKREGFGEAILFEEFDK
jgi:hypothetical protein